VLAPRTHKLSTWQETRSSNAKLPPGSMFAIPAVAPTQGDVRKRSATATCRPRRKAIARRARQTAGASIATRSGVRSNWITTTTRARFARGLVALAIAGSKIALDLSASRAFIRSHSAVPDDAKPKPVPFPVDATVNGVRVVVTLMLRPGTTVTAAPLTIEFPQDGALFERDVHRIS
jgi:hypothetical protein